MGCLATSMIARKPVGLLVDIRPLAVDITGSISSPSPFFPSIR